MVLSLQTGYSDGFAIKVLKGLFMSKIFDGTNVLTLTHNAPTPDKESVKAQKQWEKDGTVSTGYLRHVLGDISVGVSAFLAPDENKEFKGSKGQHKA